MKKSELRQLIREELLWEEKQYKKGDIVVLKQDLYYYDKDEADKLTTIKPTKYAHKGEKFTALNSGTFDDIMWEGSKGQETSLNKHWVK